MATSLFSTLLVLLVILASAGLWEEQFQYETSWSGSSHQNATDECRTYSDTANLYGKGTSLIGVTRLQKTYKHQQEEEKSGTEKKHWSWGFFVDDKIPDIQRYLEGAAQNLAGEELEDYQKAHHLFLELAQHTGHEMLALQETWNDEDSALLDSGGVLEWMRMSSDEIRACLPRKQDLPFLFNVHDTLVMVGNSPLIDTLGNGTWIDEHQRVVRFNDFRIDKSLGKSKWGRKTTDHCVNMLVKWCCKQSIPLYELDTANGFADAPWTRALWQRRLQSGSAQPLFFIRPSARKLFGRNMFTRGFTFFMVAGRYYKIADLIGFSGTEDFGKHHIREKGINFEHRLFEALRANGIVSLRDLA